MLHSSILLVVQTAVADVVSTVQQICTALDQQPCICVCMAQGKDVEYALRAIPLGGFVAFPDDDPKLAEKYPKDDPNLLKNRPIKDRALVISAGIIANCIFAFSLLLTQVNLPLRYGPYYHIRQGQLCSS